MELDIRWKQRFSNYEKALAKLEEAIRHISANNDQNIPYENWLDEMIKEALIQRFEYTHELAWNLIKDYIHY